MSPTSSMSTSFNPLSVGFRLRAITTIVAVVVLSTVDGGGVWTMKNPILFAVDGFPSPLPTSAEVRAVGLHRRGYHTYQPTDLEAERIESVLQKRYLGLDLPDFVSGGSLLRPTGRTRSAVTFADRTGPGRMRSSSISRSPATANVRRRSMIRRRLEAAAADAVASNAVTLKNDDDDNDNDVGGGGEKVEEEDDNRRQHRSSIFYVDSNSYIRPVSTSADCMK